MKNKIIAAIAALSVLGATVGLTADPPHRGSGRRYDSEETEKSLKVQNHKVNLIPEFESSLHYWANQVLRRSPIVIVAYPEDGLAWLEANKESIFAVFLPDEYNQIRHSSLPINAHLSTEVNLSHIGDRLVVTCLFRLIQREGTQHQVMLCLPSTQYSQQQ